MENFQNFIGEIAELIILYYIISSCRKKSNFNLTKQFEMQSCARVLIML